MRSGGTAGLERQHLPLVGQNPAWGAMSVQHRDTFACTPRVSVLFMHCHSLVEGDHGQENLCRQSFSATTATKFFISTFLLGGTAPSPFCDYSSPKASDRGSFYTSLISDDDLYSLPQDPSYFTGIMARGDGQFTTSASAEGFPTQDGTSFESRGLFSSDSGIEMTPAESTDASKTFPDPTEQMKSEAYKYMDISRSEDIKCQERIDTGRGDVGPPGLYQQDITGSKGTAASAKEPGASAGSAFSTDTFGDHQYHASVTAPVKITLTTAGSIEEPFAKEKTPEKPEAGLKLSHEGVPVVTVSEPEDDSPGSLTPPSSGTGKSCL